MSGKQGAQISQKQKPQSETVRQFLEGLNMFSTSITRVATHYQMLTIVQFD